jgi:quercetin dioxygenase-like cupin family protein
MATHHASPGEIVDLATWAQDVPNEKTKVIVKTDEMELVRLVLSAGKEFADHKVSGPCVIHCITGEIECPAMGATKALTSGQLLYLMPGEPHSVKAIADSVVLLTIIFKD